MGDLLRAVNGAVSRPAAVGYLLVCRRSHDRPTGAATPLLLLSCEGFGVIYNRDSSGPEGIPSDIDPESDTVRLRRRASRLGVFHAMYVQ